MLDTLGALGIVAIVMALAAVVLAFIFIVPEKRKARMNKFGQLLHDTLNFKFLIIEKILQALYIFLTVFFVLAGFFMLFIVVPGPYGYGSFWYGGTGLLIMVLSPIALRLAFELNMMLILLVKNAISINNKLKNQNDEPVASDPFGAPDINSYVVPERPAPQPPVQQAPTAASGFCTNCGAPLGDGDFCPSCGARVR